MKMSAHFQPRWKALQVQIMRFRVFLWFRCGPWFKYCLGLDIGVINIMNITEI